MNSVARIVDITDICQTYPGVPDHCIDRDNFHELIDQHLKIDRSHVFLEGEDGAGRTTLVAQYFRKKTEHCIGLFVDPVGRHAYDCDFIRYDLFNQIVFHLKDNEEYRFENVDGVLLDKKIYELHTHAMRKKISYIFIVDGIDDIPKEYSYISDEILNMLPMGLPKFKFIFCGICKKIYENKYKNAVIKNILLTGYSSEEAKRYLLEYTDDLDFIEEVRKISNKPGFVSTIARYLDSSGKKSIPVEDIPTEFSKVFDLEWNYVDENNEKLILYLSLLAHGRRRLSHERSCAVISDINNSIGSFLDKLSFLKKDDEGCYYFVSESFRRYASNKLDKYKSVIIELTISDLLADSSDLEAMSLLPSLYVESGQSSVLMDYLSPDYFHQMVSNCKSLRPIIEIADYGIEAARDSAHVGNLMHFVMNRSIITQLESAQTWRSEIEARTALNDFEGALAIAQCAITNEDKLHALAVVAKSKNDQGLSEGVEISEQISQLYKQINIASIGKRAYSIAEDLIFSNPELALDLVDQAEEIKREVSGMDFTLAMLTVAAIGDSGRNDVEKISSSLNSRIKDEDLKRFLSAATLTLGNYSVEDVVSEVDKFSNQKDALIFLRKWCVANYKKDGSEHVVEYALNKAINYSEQVQNAACYREISTPLPYVSDMNTKRKLVNILDAQLRSIQDLGPTEDYVRLMICLAEAEYKYDIDACENRLAEIYCGISVIKDPVLQCNCLSYLLRGLNTIEDTNKFTREADLKCLVREDLEKGIDFILAGTAGQLDSVIEVVKALSSTDSAFVLKTIEKINTNARRCEGYLAFIDNYFNDFDEITSFALCLDLIGKIEIPEFKNQAIASLIHSIENKIQLFKVDNLVLCRLFRVVSLITDLPLKCNVYCSAIKIFINGNLGCGEDIEHNLLLEMENSWKEISPGYLKISVGYQIISEIAIVLNGYAKKYIEYIEEEKSNYLLHTHDMALNYFGCLCLCVRAFSGLIEKELFTDEDFGDLEDLIDEMRSPGERVKIWSMLASYFYRFGNIKTCNEIAINKIRPNIDSLVVCDYYTEVLEHAAPILFVCHDEFAIDLLKSMGTSDADRIIYRICDFLLKKNNTIDPYESSENSSYDISYIDICNIAKLLEYATIDSTIYYLIKQSCAAINSKKYKFNENEKNEIKRRFSNIISQKLPDTNNIKHDGFKILANASVGSILKSNDCDWQKLLEDSYKIKNFADKSFVLSFLYSYMPTKYRNKNSNILDNIVTSIEKIPSDLDKIVRYEEIADNFKQHNKNFSRTLLSKAVDVITGCQNIDRLKVQKRIVDCAYRLDPDYADKIIDLFDTDPARLKSKRELKKHVKSLSLKDKLIDNVSGSSLSIDYSDINGLPNASWKALGALNSHMIQPIHLEKVLDVAKLGSNFTMDEAYPLMSYAIQNLVARYSKTEMANKYIRATYNSTLLAAHLSIAMAKRSNRVMKKSTDESIRSKSRNLLFSSGEKDKAILQIEAWLEENLGDELIICDPYFGPDELIFLRKINSINDACNVTILTSLAVKENDASMNPASVYENKWKYEISQQTSPMTELVIIYSSVSNKFPIHDRWILSGDFGLKIGTSLNSLGDGGLSEISILESGSVPAIRNELQSYANKKQHLYKGERLKYRSFTL